MRRRRPGPPDLPGTGRYSGVQPNDHTEGVKPCRWYPLLKPVADPALKAVRFAMKDGAKKITILVSNRALETIEIAPAYREAYFGTFKVYRKSFERIASKKYDKGYVENDGTVCTRAMDLPLARAVNS
jgi:hypothetical protein